MRFHPTLLFLGLAVCSASPCAQVFTVAYSGLKIDDLAVRYTGVPEPETYAGVAGLALSAWAFLLRRSQRTGRPAAGRTLAKS